MEQNVPRRRPNTLYRYHGAVTYLIGLLTVAVLVVSIFTLIKVNRIAETVISEPILIDEFLEQLTNNPQATQYKEVAPVNVVQVNANNLDALQQQIAGLDTSFIGTFVVVYSDNVIVYDYDNDNVLSILPIQQPASATQPAPVPQPAPQGQNDFTQKLFAHPETQDLQGQEVEGIQLSQDDIATLFQQNPVQYQDVKEGDFFLQFPDRIVVYDYAKDRIVTVVEQSDS